ncbi:MAG: excinuclease ABC subunit UvrC [Legionellaceae bacterium]
MSETFDYVDFLAHLTSQPGVYRMKNAQGDVIYVGKANNLKKRVSSYFNQIKDNLKTQALVRQIRAIEITVTRTETEALLLESSLIKALRPKYNVLMRDDKSYPYLRVDLLNDFPSLTLVRAKKKPTEKGYFGPYTGILAVRETLNLIQKIFKLRNCSDVTFKARTRPCLQYQLKRCTAPCVGYISAEDYQTSVKNTCLFLQGKSSLILDDLTLRMRQAADALAFEEARLLRDQIKALRVVQAQQGMIQLQGDLDVVVLEALPGFGCVQWVSIRDGKVLDTQSFFPQVPKLALSDDSLGDDVFSAFMTHYYVSEPTRIPRVILTDHPLVHHEALASWLSEVSGHRCRIQIRSRGIKARWIDFARDNLRVATAERHATQEKIAYRYEALKQVLGLGHAISTMVCFDISHTQGTDTVASCVVFNALGPLKSAYRRFNIKGITPGDDYAAMEQALGRYFKGVKKDNTCPDLLIIDGGKGQHAVAVRVLKALEINDVYVLGIAKGPGRKAGLEMLVVPDENRLLTLSPDSPALHLLQHIRDEAHRFAIQSHRRKREKTSLSSSLTTIPGVGTQRRYALLQHFGGLRELSKASLEQITQVHGISEGLALKIYQYFHDQH